jgi:ribose transport system ATP-binding protein
MLGIGKDFPGVHALTDCRFDLYPGEVHALVGENGAGKSTLMKILAGVYRRDSGTIRIKGSPVNITSTGAAQRIGISMIHQELNLAPHLTVAQNIYLGQEPRRFGFLLDDRALNDRAAELFETLHLNLDPRKRVSALAVAQQQMVEIAKALSFNADILIMDEPTAALTDTEIAELFRITRELRRRGVGVVHISHRLQELKQISDRVTVMRDGRYVDTKATADVSFDQIVSMMVGRTIFEVTPEVPEHPSPDVVLEDGSSATSASIFTAARFSGSRDWSGRVERRSLEPSSELIRWTPARSSSTGGRSGSIARPMRSAMASATCPRIANATAWRSA